MTLAIRVIATLLLDPARGVIKGRQFAHDRVIGEPIQWARVMAQLREVDELCILDVTHNAPDLALFERICAEVNIPVAYGGGIHDWDTARRFLRGGADKLVLTPRAGWSAGSLGQVIADRAGSQAVVACLDYTAGEPIGMLAHEMAMSGAGEVLLQCPANDGTMMGYNLLPLEAVRARVDVPVIASSGAGSPADCVAAVRAGADAVACGAMYAFSDTTPNDVKRALHEAGYPVRLMEAV